MSSTENSSPAGRDKAVTMAGFATLSAVITDEHMARLAELDEDGRDQLRRQLTEWLA